jgi:hypothetical protein
MPIYNVEDAPLKVRPTLAASAKVYSDEEITTLRLHLHDNGYRPVPVVGIHVINVNSPGKQPRMLEWQTRCLKATPEEIEGWMRDDSDCVNTGLLCDEIEGVDIDILDPEIAAERVARALQLFGPTPLIRIGREPKTLLMYRIAAPHGKFSTTEMFFGDNVDEKDMKVQVEFLGSNRQQFVAFGLHPHSREPYYWPDRSPLDIPLADVPFVTLELLEQFKVETEQVLRTAGARSREEILASVRKREHQGYEYAGVRDGEREDCGKADYNKVKEALDHLPNDFDRFGYIDIGYAVYHGLEENGWSLFNDWAKRHPTYQRGKTVSDWRSFKKGHSIKIGTLFWHAGQRGWRSKDHSSSFSGKTHDKSKGGGFSGAEAKPEPPRPLTREILPAEDFPIEALGDWLGPAARGICDLTDAPMAICAQSIFAAATLAVQAYADVELMTGEVRPVSLFFITVAVSGERKSSADRLALKPVQQRRKELKDQHKIDRPRYENSLLAWQKARDAAVKAANGDRAAIEAALSDLGPEPVAPLEPRFLCTEPTIEGLYKLLMSCQPSAGIFSDEGGSFIAGHGMTDETIARTATALSKLWDGTELDRTRGGDGSSSLPGRRLSTHLMAQPGVAARLLSSAFLLDQGLLSRYLVTEPQSNIGGRPHHAADPASRVAIDRYSTKLLSTLRRPMPLVTGTNNELSPPVMKLSANARKMAIGFYDDTEDKQKANREFAPISGLASKLMEISIRLAAVLTLVDDIEAHEVSEAHMAAGVVLAQFYAGEALRLFEVSRISADLLLAKKLLNWLKGRSEPLISMPDIYMRGLNAVGDKATASRMVEILEDHGWLVRMADGAEVGGCYRREVFRIVRE